MNAVALDTRALNDALSSNYLMAHVRISVWGERRTDHEASDEITESKNATKGSAKVIKRLLAGADTEYQAVKEAEGAIRKYVKGVSLPWSRGKVARENGERIILSSKALEFIKTVEVLKGNFKQAVRDLVAVWDTVVQEAQQNLGGMGKSEEYPSSLEIKRYFSCSVELKPIPIVKDFSRLNVPADLAQALGNEHQRAAQQQVDNAMQDLRDRFTEYLGNFEKYTRKKGDGERTRLHDSLVKNIEGVVRLARDMNMTNNPKLTELADRIESNLLRFPVETLRKDAGRAKEVADIAKEIQTDMAVEEVWSQIGQAA